ncbi:TraX family protein [Xanthomonas phaseoli]|uniref:TraX family protein n=1 Tax=Xanthomonas phaseoli TaxID=1985254 RepID=UPI001EFF5641|nr:TraX family protein [Xanthomonas phaseoli]
MRSPWPVVLALASLCWFNASLWAVLAVPAIAFGEMATSRGLVVPRTRVAFYGYYVGHLFLLALLAALPAFQQHIP